MAAPQQWRARPARPWTEERRAPGRGAKECAERSRQLARRRRFWVLVVLPVALMLGSVYLHTVSTSLTSKSAVLQQKISGFQDESQRLEVRVSELSSPGRVRSIAAEKLNMKEPSSSDIKVYDGNESNGEDGKQNAREKIGTKSQ